jgi:hypothetical protein
MAKGQGKTRNVQTQMGGAFTTRTVPMRVGDRKDYEVVTEIDLGQKKAPTPTQTAGTSTRPDRAGTKPFKYGKTST